MANDVNNLRLVPGLLRRPSVTRHSCSAFFAIACFLILIALTPARAFAQTPPQPPAASPAPDDDDDAKLRPLDPDFTVVNLPTTLPLPFHAAGNFHLTHRFVGVDWRRDDLSSIASNLFGFDGPAVIQLEYRIAVMKHLEAIVARTNFGRTIQFSGKYDAMHQSASHPFGLSALVSVEGQNNFHATNTSGTDIGYTPAIGVALSRTLGSVASVYVDPIFAHNTQDAGLANKVNTFYIGLGGRVRLRPDTYVVAEVSPRVGGFVQGTAEVAVSLEKRVGGHVFSLVIANTQATTFGQLARGASLSADDHSPIYIGFNLARKFY
jgi:uncharacterized beta barrel domain-containing protein DUF5777